MAIGVKHCQCQGSVALPPYFVDRSMDDPKFEARKAYDIGIP